MDNKRAIIIHWILRDEEKERLSIALRFISAGCDSGDNHEGYHIA